MPNYITKTFVLTDTNENTLLQCFLNASGEVTLSQEEPMDAPYFSVSINKADWEDMKEFIDAAFKQV